MAVEDYLEPEVAAAAAVTAVIASPKVRQWLRKGAVLGLAGILAAGDAVSTLAKSAGRGAKQAATEINDQAHTIAAEKAPDSAEHKANGKHTSHHAKHPEPETPPAVMEEPQGGTAE